MVGLLGILKPASYVPLDRCIQFLPTGVHAGGFARAVLLTQTLRGKFEL